MLKSLSALNVIKKMVSVFQIIGKKNQLDFSELLSREHVYIEHKGILNTKMKLRRFKWMNNIFSLSMFHGDK